MSTITHTSGSFQAFVDGYEGHIPTRTLVHDILGRPDPDVTLRPSGLRSGTLSLVFPNRLDAWAAVAVLRVSQVLTLTDPDVTNVGMTFVVPEGELVARLDDATRGVWLVEAPFQEVVP